MIEMIIVNDSWVNIIYFVITVTSKPSIIACLIRASVMEGAVEDDYVEADCQNINADTVYTNLRLTKIKVGNLPYNIDSLYSSHFTILT